MIALLNPYVDVAAKLPFDRGEPFINGPAAFGVSPGKPCLYAFPVRGERPLRFSVEGDFPSGINLDPVAGCLSGKTDVAGIFPLTIKAENRHGRAEKKFQLCVQRDKIALTPLLGWTSWNAFMEKLNQKKILENARLLAELGLAARGYSYVNIDSCWQGIRDAETCALQPNSRFPDMAGLVKEIHGLGLKAGIYSTPMVVAWGTKPPEVFPGSTSYPLDPGAFHGFFGGCGQTHYEQQDADQWAKWGFDYLKYDWPACDIEHCRIMSEALRRTDRDFVFSLTTRCKSADVEQYRKYANMYRDNIDVCDLWKNIRQNAFSANEWSKHVGPGGWFDMDMLALGKMEINGGIENRLTRDEKITHMSMWALFPSPIQISCDLSEIDDFTLDLLSNEEILAINQDYPGCGAEEMRSETATAGSLLIRDSRIYRRPLSDGRSAYGFFNLADTEQLIEFDFGKEVFLREPWALRDLGAADKIQLLLPPHGGNILAAAHC